jgi:hypothetical protein
MAAIYAEDDLNSQPAQATESKDIENDSSKGGGPQYGDISQECIWMNDPEPKWDRGSLPSRGE